MGIFSLFTLKNLAVKSKAPTLPTKLSSVNGSWINRVYSFISVNALFFTEKFHVYLVSKQ